MGREPCGVVSVGDWVGAQHAAMDAAARHGRAQHSARRSSCGRPGHRESLTLFAWNSDLISLMIESRFLDGKCFAAFRMRRYSTRTGSPPGALIGVGASRRGRVVMVMV